MGSEQGPVDRRNQHIEAMRLFDRELDSLIYPKTKEGLKEATRNLLVRVFGYGYTSAETRVEILDEHHSIPSEHEIEDYHESLSEMLKIELFVRLPEEYIILKGREEFDVWIGPFLQSVLVGHNEQSQSYEHLYDCFVDKDHFCPARIIKRVIRGDLIDQTPSIHEGKAHNEGYLVYPNELIYMNIRVVEELRFMGAYGEIEAKKLLEDYHGWLDSIDDMPFEYDQSLFD